MPREKSKVHISNPEKIYIPSALCATIGETTSSCFINVEGKEEDGCRTKWEKMGWGRLK
jgi:hypothetical protein